jgi:hypothetical protein
VLTSVELSIERPVELVTRLRSYLRCVELVTRLQSRVERCVELSVSGI